MVSRTLTFSPSERFLAANDIDVAGIKMIVDEDGVAWTYDVNTTTN